MKQVLLAAIVTGVLSGCATSGIPGVKLPCNLKLNPFAKNIDPASGAWGTVETETNKWSNARESRQVKVSISDFRTDSSTLRGQISRQVRDSLAAVVSGAGAGVIDRSTAAALQSEIIAAQQAQRRIASARLKAIDFALVGTLNAPVYSAELGSVGAIDALRYAKDGVQAKKGDPLCRYKATVRGTLQLFRVASNEVVQEWPLEGSSSDSDPNPRVANCDRTTRKQAELMGEAADSAVRKVQDKPLEWLRPVGYVLEKKQDEKGRSIFRTSLGSRTGILDARSASIVQKKPFMDPIRNETVIEEVRLVQKASILRNHTNDQYSWVYVDDTAKANVIKIGDIVEQQGTCS